MQTNQRNISSWAWVPSLYFAEGLPYVIVMTLSVIMYKDLGISNSDIAFYTSWLYLPWVIKPLWSPIVELFKTKRWWIVTMQFLMGVGMAGVAFTLDTSFFFQSDNDTTYRHFLLFQCILSFTKSLKHKIYI